MEKYDYMEHLREDILLFLGDNEDRYGLLDILRGSNDLYDELWMTDSVTVNASGSYTFSTWDAEECLCHNWGLMQEMCDEYASNPRTSNPEILDVGIRCYLLTPALENIANDLRVKIENLGYARLDDARKMLEDVGEEAAYSLMDDDLYQYIKACAPVHSPDTILAYYMGMHLLQFGEEYTVV